MSIIMKSTKTGIVVEFNGLTSGFVIDCGTAQNPVGRHSTSWFEHTNRDRWEPLWSKRALLHKRIKEFL